MRSASSGKRMGKACGRFLDSSPKKIYQSQKIVCMKKLDPEENKREFIYIYIFSSNCFSIFLHSVALLLFPFHFLIVSEIQPLHLDQKINK